MKVNITQLVHSVLQAVLDMNKDTGILYKTENGDCPDIQSRKIRH